MKDLMIFKNEEFGEIQILENNNKYEFEATGSARVLGYKNPGDAIQRHCKKYGVVKHEVGVQTGYKKDGTPAIQMIEKNFISEGNLYRLITHSKLPSAEKFEKWVYDEVIPSIRATGTYTVKKRHKPIDRALRQHMNIAMTLIQNTGVKAPMAYAIALNEAEKETGYSYNEYKKLLPSPDYEIGYLNPTKIGKKIGLKPAEVNKKLEKMGLQAKIDKEWRLTDEGKKYGEEQPYTRNGHSSYHIQWNDEILKIFDMSEVV